MQHKEAKNSQSEKQKEKRIQITRSISSLWDNFKKSNIQIIGVPEGEEKKQDTGNPFEKIMKENSPNLVKEIDMLNPRSTESQTRWTQRGPLQDTS